MRHMSYSPDAQRPADRLQGAQSWAARINNLWNLTHEASGDPHDLASTVGKIILKATWSFKIGPWTRSSYLRLKSRLRLQNQARLIYPVNSANDDVMRSSRVGHSTSEYLVLFKRKSLDLLSSRAFFSAFDWKARKVIANWGLFAPLCPREWLVN